MIANAADGGSETVILRDGNTVHMGKGLRFLWFHKVLGNGRQ